MSSLILKDYMCLIFLQGEADRFLVEITGEGGTDRDLHGRGWRWDDASAGV